MAPKDYSRDKALVWRQHVKCGSNARLNPPNAFGGLPGNS